MQYFFNIFGKEKTVLVRFSILFIHIGRPIACQNPPSSCASESGILWFIFISMSWRHVVRTQARSFPQHSRS